ncbi:hypothetical protein GCM10010193_27140 [Kitasatospora atroaurantiaca]|uniref:Uncharacterized protein n=1 Tax=Kitasatospora atroaurantiaca TaxID=285545 RepID=A0A561EK16_9ACTN|nr:hypothetical protein [Kitasatospora atroaurantiaca]TWE15963.1 hypothetical protein FB465_0919 [Kitasatospora atroaurantiaca]
MDQREDTRLDQRPSTTKTGPLRRAWLALCGVRGSTVVVLLAFSLGLLAVGVQVHSTFMRAMFGIVWFATFVALIGLAGHWMMARTSPGRHRRPA